MNNVKYLLKRVSLLITTLALTLFIFQISDFKALASEIPDKANENVVTARLINMETGEVTNLDVDDVTIELKPSNINFLETYGLASVNNISSETFSKTYTVTVELPSSTGISIQSSAGGNKTENSVKAVGTINYTKSGDYITVSSCSGSWTPSISSLYMSDREVWLYSGVPMGKYLEKYPTKNTFSYNTGWSKTLYYPGSSISGTRLFTSAVARISGMTATYTIELLVTV
ncbi:hypothetical protein [Konateibacter massiliensis]|uniref:hypothetical protein n=1 Tax=Konateibacter massiliensis TaxID=2002841 RepID=UPI000C1509CC|nr:hypothetical protein [Konateibacter massiliensis]